MTPPWRGDGFDDDREDTWISRLGCLVLIALVLAVAGWTVWMRCHPVVSIGGGQ